MLTMSFNAKKLLEAFKTARFFAENEVYCLAKSTQS